MSKTVNERGDKTVLKNRRIAMKSVALVTVLSVLPNLSNAADKGRKHSKGMAKGEVPQQIETKTEVEKSIGLGPHPTDPSYTTYKKKFDEEFTRRSRAGR